MGNEHSRGGVTTRDDAADLGVDMLPGDPNEPQGPEDAFGPGPKRGDYTGRVGPDRHVQMVPGPNGAVAVDQVARAGNRGEVAGLKGGVETTEDATSVEVPNASDSKDDWVAYAETQGYDSSEGLTKDELRERYG